MLEDGGFYVDVCIRKLYTDWPRIGKKKLTCVIAFEERIWRNPRPCSADRPCCVCVCVCVGLPRAVCVCVFVGQHRTLFVGLAAWPGAPLGFAAGNWKNFFQENKTG